MTDREAIEILSIIRNAPSIEVFNVLPNNDEQLNFDFRTAFDLAIKALEKQIKHGNWKLISKYYDDRAQQLYGKFECSCCGEHRYFYEIPETTEEYFTDAFCSFCGADMRGD